MITVHGENTTVEQLHEIPLIRFERAGGRWQGIQHGELVSAILDEARCRKWMVNSSKFSVSAKGADIVGAFDLSVPDMPAPDGQTLSMGVINSNSHKSALTLLVGTTVTVCTNGMATGEIVLRNKHINGFDLYDGFELGFDEYERQDEFYIEDALPSNNGDESSGPELRKLVFRVQDDLGPVDELDFCSRDVAVNLCLAGRRNEMTEAMLKSLDGKIPLTYDVKQ